MKTALQVMPLLRGPGLNAHVRDWNRVLTALFPIADQADTMTPLRYRGRPYAAFPIHYVDWRVALTGGYETQDLDIFAAIARACRSVRLLGHHDALGRDESGAN